MAQHRHGNEATVIYSIDPRTGDPREAVANATDPAELDTSCQRAKALAGVLEALGREGRAGLLEAMADALEERRPSLVPLADAETALGETRLNGELTRTAFQLRFFAQVLRDGAYLEATIDHAGDTAMGPRPDLRRMLRPLGPVAVFGASNFPFAFSVPGGDTASALAAGCPVLVKAHEAHPATSIACHAALRAGAGAAGISPEIIQLVFGVEAGAQLVRHEAIRAVGFTGSLHGGRALFDLASTRAEPIPFYGELGALNAVAVLAGAAAQRPAEIASGLAGSFTLGVGQFCTKPGLVLVPSGTAGDGLVGALAEAVAGLQSTVMLSPRIAEAFASGAAALGSAAGVRILAEASPPGPATGSAGRPLLLEADAGQFSGVLTEECFGPVLVVIRYGSDAELSELIAALPSALTATVHGEESDIERARPILAAFEARAGRVVWNGYPTGVAVAWAMHHGGSYPATTDPLHTSVGATAIRRWLRPVAYQSLPTGLLPNELREPMPGETIARRIDGKLSLS